MKIELRWALRKQGWLWLLVLVSGLCSCGKKEEDVAAEAEVEVLDQSVVEELALEEVQLAKILKGWKAKGYRGVRGGLVKTALGLVGAVEGNAANPLLDNLPEPVRATIESAAGEAGVLKELAENPPAEIGLVVATGYLVHLQKTPALCELQLVDPEEFATQGGRSGFLVVRGVTYFMHGLKQHGLRDLRAANVGSAEDLPTEVRQSIYFGAAAAAIAADEPRMVRTQLELAEELSPGDPMIVFLRAEQEISKGNHSAAKESLSAWRAGNPVESGVVAKVIDGRITDLQAAGEPVGTVLTEPKWLVDFGLDYIAEQAENYESFRKLDEVTGTARSLVTDLLGQLNRFGS